MLPTAVQWSHHLLRQYVKPGDAVVDATAGNGHDTLLLAELVGPAGQVFAFDVQAAAIHATRQRLGTQAAQCTLIQASHHVMAEHLPTQVAAVLFNLGYLPGADKSCITQTETTLQALDSALALLKPHGLLVVVVYPGHTGGDAEAAAVADKLSGIPWAQAEVQHLRPANRTTRSPECWVAVRCP
jgi:predicted methyltransferase